MNLDTIMIMPLDMLLFFLSFRTNLLIDLFLIYLSVMHTKCSTVLMILVIFEMLFFIAAVMDVLQ